MKIKKACLASGLTERAVRLYLSKNLLSPERKNGILDFSPKDVALLKDIAILRQFDFSIEQIRHIIHSSSSIGGVIDEKIDQINQQQGHLTIAARCLYAAQQSKPSDMQALANSLRQSSSAPVCPNFGQYDEPDNTPSAEPVRYARTGRYWAIISIVLASILLFFIFLLSRTRLEGYLPITPFTVLQVQENAVVHIQTENPTAIKFLGTDSIFVPCRCFGPALKAGDRLDSGCQLAVKLKNRDLIQLGISPFQNLNTPSTDVNNAWIEWILQQLSAKSIHQNMTLWVREISTQKPLIQQ